MQCEFFLFICVVNSHCSSVIRHAWDGQHSCPGFTPFNISFNEKEEEEEDGHNPDPTE